MRVIAGSARRLKLIAPPGEETRPTQDIIKETLFNMIHQDLPGAVFADLYAGSGAIGIEALSRGAKKAYFIENKSAALQCLFTNLETTHFGSEAVVFKGDVVASLSRIKEEALDFIYMDPPYEAKLYAPTLEVLSNASFVTPHTVIIAECALPEDFAYASRYGFDVIREKRYKHSKHVFLQRGTNA